eukprot:5418894-Amphidinium_carterae.1
MDQSAVQSMSLICALVSATPIALVALGVSQKVMSEISQISKNVIGSAIKINRVRNQRKVRSEKYKRQKSTRIQNDSQKDSENVKTC